MGGFTFAVVIHGGDGDGGQTALLGFLQYFNASGIQASMREDKHDVSVPNRLVFKQDSRIALSPFQPQQALCASRANYVGPHEPHIHQRTKSGIYAVTWKHVLHWQDGMAAAEKVHQAATHNALGHHS